MKIIRRADQCSPEEGPVCAAIGFFDGLHLGHQQVLRIVQSEAQQHRGQSVVITFDRHPLSIVAPHKAPGLVYPLSKKIKILESLGVDIVLLLSFDAALSRMTASEFIRGPLQQLGRLSSLCVGSNFHFGYQRSGNVELLVQWGQKMNFRVHGVPSIPFEGAPVSSTRIRDAIRQGHLLIASQMLGRAYSLTGRVCHGDHLGRELGFPTANLEVDDLVVPPGGVYACWAWLKGRKLPAVLNIGCRPTLRQPRPHRQIEVHLLDFSGDLYDQELEIEWQTKLREEMCFPNLPALQGQITQDIQQARHCLLAEPSNRTNPL